MNSQKDQIANLVKLVEDQVKRNKNPNEPKPSNLISIVEYKKRKGRKWKKYHQLEKPLNPS